MVVVPEFTISQDQNFVYVNINCPNVRASDMELVIIGTEFHFSADPYLLFLNFAHKVLDNENGTAKYDIDTGVFSVKLEKEIHGEDFPELLLLSTLKPKPKDKPLIQVVSEKSSISYDDYDPDPTKYGFNFWSRNYFENVEDTIPYVCDLPQPDQIPHPLRKDKRIERELEDFDADQIMVDYIRPIDYDVKEADKYLCDFTPKESKALLEIPKIDFLMSKDTAKMCFLSCIDVVYATVYDTIIFGVEGTCESHWTISKISSTLSWFDVFETADELVMSTLKRVLVYPIYRNYDFAKLCWNKTIEMLLYGRTSLLKCLLHAKQMMEKDEFKWRLNRLYIDPMITWLQELEQSEYNSFTDEIHDAVDSFPPKESIEEDWCIDLLEKLAEKHREEIANDPPEETEYKSIQNYVDK